MAEVNRLGNWGSTSEEILLKQFPLHRACRDGDLDSLSLLLVESQHTIYEEDNFYGWTPAHWAAYFGKLNCLKLLLETELDVDVTSIRLNQTALHIAAFAGRVHCVKWLLHCGANIDRQDYLGETALHKAARTGSMECLSLLVSNGAKLQIRNNNNETASELSANCVHQEVKRYLERAVQCKQGPDDSTDRQTASVHAIKTPSPHDVTATVHNSIPITSLLTDDCPMDEEDIKVPAAASAQGPVADITTHQGITANLTSVGGRKRCLEDNEEQDYKRRRSDFSLGYNSRLTNGTTNGFDQALVVCQSGSVANSVFTNVPSCVMSTMWPLHQTSNNTRMQQDNDEIFAPGVNTKPFMESYADSDRLLQMMDNNNMDMRDNLNEQIVTTSIIDYRQSVIVEQGYDSLLHETTMDGVP